MAVWRADYFHTPTTVTPARPFAEAGQVAGDDDELQVHWLMPPDRLKLLALKEILGNFMFAEQINDRPGGNPLLAVE